MNSMKRQKDMTLKDDSPSWKVPNYATEEEQRNHSRRNEEAEAKWKPGVDVSGNKSNI